MRRWGVLGPLWLWLAASVAAPLVIVVALSFSTSVAGIPPYTPLLAAPELSNYGVLGADAYYLDAAVRSLVIAGGRPGCA